jgi:uncharacterized membrane protein
MFARLDIELDKPLLVERRAQLHTGHNSVIRQLVVLSMSNHPHQPSSTRLVERNIAALLAQRREDEKELSWQEKLADRITAFAGSMPFVWLHLGVYSLWIAINVGWTPGLPRFDPSFVILAMVASVEAIFLSTFILITQNRMQAHADRRADLNLQISLLAEHEITRLVQMVSEMGRRMDLDVARQPELEELKQDVRPEQVLETLEQRNAALAGKQSD